MRKLLFLVLALVVVLGLVACGKEKSNEEENNTDVVDIPKEEQTGTAGSSIPLKDNLIEAQTQIEIAMRDMLNENYSGEIVESRIYVTRILSAEDEAAMPALKQYNLSSDEIAFEVNYELYLADGVDPNKFTAGSGTYDEDSGWVTEKYNTGILRKSTSEEGKYYITDFGTAF